ncbi:HlyD family secretion protein [Nonlabens dokdonensis]|uniref:Membrane fusion efflux transporter, RND family n=2 Tax=Nonlabens dokdonensis TaxID=328515 RepID=L7WCT4_NONDD|nr:efflux RND transporter periplasmic adaptor subunit [Nonlabens dokdonensis]AGC76718.1 membrane fusion efflux transporter, RND family [Nonlabens dokdonensis DSW-6]PZX44365.1 HlyD family secretion protein [Nonlabens dokdonensis]
MKRTGTVITLLVIVLLAAAGIYYIWQKDQQDPITYTTEQPTKETIIKETVATGSIVPKEEVNIKPNISGVIDKVHVVAGDFVEAGDLIAEIKVVPNVSSLTNAKNSIDQARNSVQTAKLALDNQQIIYDRQKSLFEKGVVAANEFDLAQNAYNNALQRYKQEQVNLRGAQQNYDILRTGTTSGALGKYAQTAIRSTVAGMILDVPVKEGNQVIEANNFNEGTSIAVIADIKKMIFEGKVDESEVGKIKEGLDLEITVGAFDNKKFDAILDYVAPKGIAENGAIQFAIKGTLKETAKDSTFIRAGLSANASIILDRRDNVLSIKEALVQYDPETKKPFVEVATGDQQFERRDVELGLSNGINVEVISGVSEGDNIKVWNALKAPTGRGGYGG